jgi:ATP adenylyltransferase
MVEKLYRPQGLNLGYTSGRPGEHLGVQVVPRWAGDANFMPILADITLLPETTEQTHARVLAELSRRGLTP